MKPFLLLLLIPVFLYSQNAPIEIELTLLKDSFERFEPFEYCVSNKNISGDSLLVQRLAPHVLEVKKVGSDNPWQPLWESEFPLYEPNGWVSTINLLHLGVFPSLWIPDGAIFQKQIKQFFPLNDSLHPMLFVPESEFSIRLKRNFGGQVGVIYSKPDKIYIKKDNLFNLDLVENLRELDLGIFHAYAPWNFLVGQKNYPIDSSDIKTLVQVIERHPNSDFYDWLQFRKYNSQNDIGAYSDFDISINHSLLLRMLSNDFYPKCLLLERLDSIVNQMFLISNYEGLLTFEKFEKQIKDLMLVCECD